MFNGAKFIFEDYFLKSSASSSNFLFYNKINDNLIDYLENDGQMGLKSSNLARNNLNMARAMEEDLNRFKNDKLLLNETENSGQLMYLLILISFNAFIALFNSDKYNKSSPGIVKDQLDSELIKKQLEYKDKKLSYLDSIRNDYRLKNFFCLYKFAELNYDESGLGRENEDEKMETNLSLTSDTIRVLDHLKYSLDSLKSLFKMYIDDYFDFS